MTEGEVLPCPFCGGDTGYSVEGFVFCRPCGTQGPVAPVEGEPGMAKRDAIAAWNRRAAPPKEAEPWRPIETAPKDGTRILVWDMGAVAFGFWWETTLRPNGGFWIVEYGDESPERSPSHWRPLPSPPDQKKG